MGKILIADDDATTRALLVKTIEGMGYPTVQASDGKRAYDVLLDNPDVMLLVTDIMMPEIDGRMLVQLMRGNHSTQNIPVIMLSGVIKLREIREVLQLGVTRFVPKPINIPELKKYINDLIK